MAEASSLAIETLVDRAQRLGNREWRIGGDFFGEKFGALHQLRGGDDFIDQANAMRLVCIDDRAGEKELQCGAAADQARQALRAAVAADHAELDLRLAETSVVGGDAQAAGHGQLAAASESKAMNAGDDRLAEGFDLAEDSLTAEGEFAALIGSERRQFANVGAGGEGAVPGAGDEDHANGAVGGQIVEHSIEFGEGRGVQRVEDFGAIKGDDRKRRTLFETKICGVHANKRLAELGVDVVASPAVSEKATPLSNCDDAQYGCLIVRARISSSLPMSFRHPAKKTAPCAR